MGSRAARFKQIDVERAITAARKVYGREVPVAIEPSGRIIILTGNDNAPPLDSFD